MGLGIMEAIRLVQQEGSQAREVGEPGEANLEVGVKGEEKMGHGEKMGKGEEEVFFGEAGQESPETTQKRSV